MGKRGPRGIDPGVLQVWQDQWFQAFRFLRDGTQDYDFSVCNIREDPVSKLPLSPLSFDWEPVRVKGIPAESHLWEALKNTTEQEAVRAICEQSRFGLNPKFRGRVFLEDLPRHAADFLAAKALKRYPRSARPSSDDARIAFLATAMAGIAWGIGAATAIKLVGSTKLRREINLYDDLLEQLEGHTFVLENSGGNYFGDGVTYWRPPGKAISSS